MAPREPERPSQRRRESGTRKHTHDKKRKSSSRQHTSTEESSKPRGSGHVLSIDALARLNDANTQHIDTRDTGRQRERERQRQRQREREHRRQRERQDEEEREEEREREREAVRERRRRRESRARKAPRDGDGEGKTRRHRSSKSRRAASGARLEEGRGWDWKLLRGGGSSCDSVEKEDLDYRSRPRWNKKRLWILGGIAAVVVLIVIIAVAVVVSQKSAAGSSDSKTASLGGISPSSVPAGAPSYLDPFQWQDTTDFNLTYTAQTVGDLPVMGLFSSWDDSKAANSRVPALEKPWGPYATNPARGVNLGGWLSLEPFITPSLFAYDAKLGIIDEWTLCTYLGAAKCASTLEQHYSAFVTEQTFADIAAAGLDHVRIPYSYWAVQLYDSDPYVFRTSWRYLLRGIEWARKHGLRVNLDLHALPGSQNGWNHSGRQGAIGWMNGTNGALNVQRSLDVHDRLSRFFAQDRYRNVISHYGLANEPRMTFLSVASVMAWTQQAAALVRKNGLAGPVVVFGDGFCGLDRWQGQPGAADKLALDVHQYVIFNNAQIVLGHGDKIRYACTGWTDQTQRSIDPATGFGPTIVAEWSQADTDCARWLGNVNNGNRWTGTYNVGNASLNALTPRCPTLDSRCDCSAANADPSTYSPAYKRWLLMFAEAQMFSFEKGHGWWYWTWDTESASQWSYKQGLAAGILPPQAWQRDFQCDLTQIPSFSDLAETY